MKKCLLGSVLVPCLMLVGCAATPKPELTGSDSKNIVESWVLIHKCTQQSNMSPELSATGITILRNELNTYTYDSGQLNAQISSLMSDGLRPTIEGCNLLAMRIAERKQQIVANIQAADFNQKQAEDFVNSTKTINTQCNRIGTSTFCNTY